MMKSAGSNTIGGIASFRFMIGRSGLILLLLIMLLAPSIERYNFESDVSDSLQNQLNTPNPEQCLTQELSTIQVFITMDSDDDWWGLEGVTGHFTDATEVYCRNTGSNIYIGQFRFQLNISKYSTIYDAEFAAYEEYDGAPEDCQIYRIDETNVGPLEDDTVVPRTDNGTLAIYPFDGVADWDSCDVTDLVQDQVNLVDWQRGYFIGLQFRFDGLSFANHDWEDYQTSGTQRVAYLNITFNENDEYQDEGKSTTSSVIREDVDDCYWWYSNGSWSLETNDLVSYLCNSSATNYGWPVFRWRLDVPQGSMIQYASLSVYMRSENSDPPVYAGIYRIDRTNVEAPELMSEMPEIDTSTNGQHNFKINGTGTWTTSDLTNLVQMQVDLSDWTEGMYFGVMLQINVSDTISENLIEDYQNATSGNHAYINVTYTPPIGAQWLSGWERRKSHIIYQENGAGVEYTVPLFVDYGSGKDSGDTVYLDGNCKDGFSDVRWTAADGVTLLDYNLNDIIMSGGTDYFANDCVNFVHMPACYPGSWYFNGRTYVVYNGPSSRGPTNIAGDPYIMYYDHSEGNWSEAYKVGTNPLDNDDHGSPCMWVDNDGYIHVLYGAHAWVGGSALKHAVSNNPETISAGFTLLEDIVPSSHPTYPHVSYDSEDNIVHLYFRREVVNNIFTIGYVNSADNGRTWSNAVDLVELTTDSPYITGAGGIDPYNWQLLHFGWSRYDSGTVMEDVHYACLNVSSMHLFNASGYDLGTVISKTEMEESCKVFESGGRGVWGPDVAIDSNSTPYLLWTNQNSTSTSAGTSMFTYWTGLKWAPIQYVSHSDRYTASNALYVYSSTNISAYVNYNEDTAHYTWNGTTWTFEELMYDCRDGRDHGFAVVPGPVFGSHHEEYQVDFGDWYDANDDKAYAWGTMGILQKHPSKCAKFYVEISGNLTESNQIIYIYYGQSNVTSASQVLELTTGHDPSHGVWGKEELASSSNFHIPFINGTPSCDNMDDLTCLYAKAGTYQISASISDDDGFMDIAYFELTLTSNDRTEEYWTVRYNEDTNTFSEWRDFSDYIALDMDTSVNRSRETTIETSFSISINWNHPDLTNPDIKCYAMDDEGHWRRSYYEVPWSIETRLDLSSELMLSDGLGTPNRGDIGGDVVAAGTIVYLGGNTHPSSTEIDVYVVCNDVVISPWLAMSYQSATGAFSVKVTADEEVCEDVYEVHVVQKGQKADDTNLLHSTHTATYITDSIRATISLNPEFSTNETLTFNLELVHMFDDTPINDFIAVISKNGQIWRTISSATFTDSRNESVTNTYRVVSVNATLHGLASIYVRTNFIVSGDDQSFSSGPLPQPEDLEYLADFTGIILQWFCTFMFSIEISTIDIIMDMTSAFVGYQNLLSSELIVIGSVSLLPLILWSRRASRRNKRILDRRRREVFQEKGGLEVHSLLNVGKTKDGVYMVVRGVKMPCFLLEDYDGTAANRFKSLMTSGEKPTRLLVLYNEPILDTAEKVTIYGLILPSRSGI